jgi:Domain of unknown function (DUF4123)
MQQSISHLKSMLWATAQSRVYAFVQGSVVPQFHEQLAKADVRGWDCLWRGALSPEQRAQAPYLVELLRESKFTDALLKDVPVTYPAWGLIGVSTDAMLPVREHGRQLLKVALPDGQQRQWAWMDPVLWGGLLPQLSPEQLDAAFGRVSDWVLVSASEWRWMTLSAGVLVQDSRQVLVGAAP